MRLVGTPQVVGYRMSQINFLIGRKLIKVKWISLGNLILNRTCFRELMQYYFTPENDADRNSETNRDEHTGSGCARVPDHPQSARRYRRIRPGGARDDRRN